MQILLLNHHLRPLADSIQSAYAAELLYVPSLCFVKLSVALLLRSITPDVCHNRIILAIAITTALWAASSELAIAFQCHLPIPWIFLGNTCINRVSFTSVTVCDSLSNPVGALERHWRLQHSHRHGPCFLTLRHRLATASQHGEESCCWRLLCSPNTVNLSKSRVERWLMAC